MIQLGCLAQLKALGKLWLWRLKKKVDEELAFLELKLEI